MRVTGGKLRRRSAPTGASARRPSEAHEPLPCQRGIHAPRWGATMSGWGTGGCASPCGRGFPPATLTGPSGAGKRANPCSYSSENSGEPFMQKKPHAKDAKGGCEKAYCIHRSFAHRLVTCFPERSFPVPLRPLREVLGFELDGSGLSF